MWQYKCIVLADKNTCVILSEFLNKVYNNNIIIIIIIPIIIIIIIIIISISQWFHVK